MRKRQPSIDGFVPRRARTSLGTRSSLGTDARRNSQTRPQSVSANSKGLRGINRTMSNTASPLRSNRGIGRADIDESLSNIDQLSKSPKKISRRQKRIMKKLARKPKSKIRRLVERCLIVLAILGLCIGGYFIYKISNAGGNMLQGSLTDLFQTKKLKMDSKGRSNFLVLGTSEDDPGHPGSNLTDSMMVVSVDQTNKNIYMFSIPRDLYVDYGMACDSGYEGKINVYFSCANSGTTTADEQDRLSKTQQFVGDIFGLDIQYGLHVDLTVVKDLVDAVGGIDVNIVGSEGSSGVLDRNFDWRCNYSCYYVKYTNGVHHLDGTHAMFLAQARGDTAPTYGLANSNFDREKNQQKILIALKNKAVSTGTLTNLSAVSKLIDGLGNNLRTNIATNEIQTLMKVISSVKTSDVHTVSLIDGDNAVVTTGNYSGQSVVMPSAGVFQYSDIQDFIAKYVDANAVTLEAAPVAVFNGTETSGLAQQEADKMEAKGMTVSGVDTASKNNYTRTKIYAVGNGNSATAKALKAMYGVDVTIVSDKSKLPEPVDGSVKFVVIIGSDVNR